MMFNTCKIGIQKYLLLFVLALSPALLLANSDLSRVLTPADARHLISRTGIGITVQELARFTGRSRAQAIQEIIDGFSTTPELPMPAWTQQPAPLYWTRQDLDNDERRLFDRRRDIELAELRQWWTDNMLATTSPQTERMVLFWHDHFATSYYGINRQSKAMAMQNTTFRTLALGNFRALLKAMIRDPALLNYLDNLSNRKASPNENMARELLELFTLGEGNYQEDTVKEAARALTGFAVSQNKNLSFELKDWSFDPSIKQLFGQSGNFNADDLIDLILQQPASAQHIATRLWQAFVSGKPPTTKQLKPLVQAFIESDYELSALYRAVLEHESFWSDDARASIVKSPAQLLLGSARALGYPLTQNQQLPSLLARSGMNLLTPPNVAGWSEGEAWITPGRLLNRYAAIEELTLAGNHSVISTTGNMSMSMSMDMTDSSPITAPAMINSSAIELHVAAEDFQGAANYNIELLTINNEQLWESGKQVLHGGHDTAMYGRVRNMSNLPWQAINIAVDQHALNSAQWLRVHFLNDAAGADGDRNLFVRGIAYGNTWLDSASGEQHSKCKPRSKFDAGKLYCAGHLSIPINRKNTPSTTTINGFSASSAHVNWVRKEGGRLDLTLTLQDFKTEAADYATFSFHLTSRNGKPPRLELNNFGCWPQCISQWPDCAWKTEHSNQGRTVAFPLSGSGDNEVFKCHHNALSADEQRIVASLFFNAKDLLRSARNSNRSFNSRKTDALDGWQNLLAQQQKIIHKHYSSASPIIVDKNLKRKSAPIKPAHHFTPAYSSITELQRTLMLQDLNLAHLLLPGIDQNRLPEFSGIASMPAEKQLRLIIEHPAFQLH